MSHRILALAALRESVKPVGQSGLSHSLTSMQLLE
jgi:hypothetical protein